MKRIRSYAYDAERRRIIYYSGGNFSAKSKDEGGSNIEPTANEAGEIRTTEGTSLSRQSSPDSLSNILSGEGD